MKDSAVGINAAFMCWSNWNADVMGFISEFGESVVVVLDPVDQKTDGDDECDAGHLLSSLSISI